MFYNGQRELYVQGGAAEFDTGKEENKSQVILSMIVKILDACGPCQARWARSSRSAGMVRQGTLSYPKVESDYNLFLYV